MMVQYFHSALVHHSFMYLPHVQSGWCLDSRALCSAMAICCVVVSWFVVISSLSVVFFVSAGRLEALVAWFFVSPVVSARACVGSVGF